MSRRAAGFERVAVFLAGLLLVAAGALAVGWRQDWIPGLDDRIDLAAAAGWPDERWWPWALGAAALLLITLGIWWLAGHARRDTVGRLRLAGSGRDGRLSADSSAVVDAAGAALETAPGVTFRNGRLGRERGQLVVDLKAAVEAGVQLGEAAAAADRAAVAARAHLGADSDAQLRVVLVSTRRRSAQTRVR